jgi:hypothetical protein
MMSFIAQAGYATAVVNFTNDLSSLFVGLIGMTTLSAAVIIVEAVRYHLSQKSMTDEQMTSASVAYRQAA